MSFLNPKKQVDLLGLNPGNIVVDFGAGSGHYSLIAAEAVTQRGIVYALDINQDLLTRVKKDASDKGFSWVETIWTDLEVEQSTRLSSGIADAVILSNILFSVENKQIVVAEIKRILKPGGKVLVVEWGGSYNGIGPHPSKVFFEEDAKRLFIKNGFEISNVVNDSSHHYTFLATYTI